MANVNYLWKGAVEPGTIETNFTSNNYWLNSHDFSDASIAFGDATWEADNAEAPDGTLTAGALQATTQAGAQQPQARDTSLTIPNGGLWTLSTYVKKDTIQYAVIQVGLFDQNPIIFFDLDTGTVIDNGITDYVDAGMELATVTYPSAPAGWYRIWVTIVTVSDLLGRPLFGISELSNLHRITDPTTADRCLFWGAQFENNAAPTFPLQVTTGTAIDTTRTITYGTSPGGNVINLWKGAVEPVGAVAAALANIMYPRDSLATDEQRFQDFIDATGITQTGDLERDYRAALHSAAGIADEDIDLSIQDVFLMYWNTL